MKLIACIIDLIFISFKAIGIFVGGCLLFAFVAALIIVPIYICSIPITRRIKYHSAMDGTIDIYDHADVCSTSWRSFKQKVLKEFPFITFSRFYSFYCVNPNSWCTEEYRVYKDNDENLSFVFEFKEWKKYNKWWKQMEEEKELEAFKKKIQEIGKKQNETTIKILESVQKDVDAAFNESQKKLDEARELVIEVSERIPDTKW